MPELIAPYKNDDLSRPGGERLIAHIANCPDCAALAQVGLSNTAAAYVRGQVLGCSLKVGACCRPWGRAGQCFPANAPRRSLREL